MIRSLFIMLFVTIYYPVIGYAQDPDTVRSEAGAELERALEHIDPEDSEAGAGQLIQLLQDLASNPVDLNTATPDELLRIPGINLKKARAVAEHRKKAGLFDNIEELTEVKGIGEITLERIRPYITVGKSSTGRDSFAGYRRLTEDSHLEYISRYRRTIQDQEGFLRPDSGGYLGNPVRYYHRLRYRSDHLSANLTQEKDAGEPLAGPVNFDFTSGHLALENVGRLRSLVVGDYSISAAQGLVFWSGGLFGKGRDVIGSVSKNERGVRPYSSSQETGYFRGVAAAYGGQIRLTGFYSDRKRSATAVNADTVRFPSETGLHRTLNEIGRKNNVRQQVVGGRLLVDAPFGRIGASGYRSTFSKFIERGTGIHNRFDFEGNQTYTVGFDYHLLVGPAVLFGEGARSRSGGMGWVAGVESPVGERSEMVLVYRNYQKDFHSILGAGFGEQSGNPQNEEGVYLGVRHKVSSALVLSGYFDQYRFPAPRFGTRRPTGGFDWLGLAEFYPNRSLNLYLQIRSETKEEEFEAIDAFGREQLRLGEVRRSGLRGQVEYWSNRNVRLRTRGEVVQVRGAGDKVEYGYLIYQDVRFLFSDRLKVDGRITVFETESFESRVFQFENDLLYLFSNRMLFDRGQRIYVLVNYEPFRFLELWAKFGITVFEDRQVIGSGLDRIRGNKRSEIGVQVRVRM